MPSSPSFPRLLGPRGVAAGLLAAFLAALVIGAPTAVVPNPLFARMTPTRPQDILFLVLAALLVGLIAATYAAPTAATLPAGEARLTGGGLLSFLAIGCPICNKLVVLALGVGGALRWFEPVQPLLGIASLALLALAAWSRLRALRAGCPRCA
jgi:hypothetical protein